MTHFLRNVLRLDALATGVTAFALAALAGPLSVWLAIPERLLFWAGISLVPWVAFLVVLSRLERVPLADVWTVIVGNALWALASVVVAFSGWIDANALGTTFIVAQALVVAGFAELQFNALRRAPLAAS
jgi:hypothetical protein